ncbi:hypothetical protein AB0M29_12970 [Streptomyces sp. NPDC051976]|jgi:hypothetical protein|uniref:hypothetical protein n=1 Tax=Streptomyces sp. NPDC051976 TaxID=3154947 RepID=UPI00343F3FFF
MPEILEQPRITSGMIMSVHIAEVGGRKAISAMRAAPKPGEISGLKWAETFTMSPLRTGMMMELIPSGVCLIAAWEDDSALDRFLSHPLAKVYEGGWRARFEPVRAVGAWPGLPDLPRREVPTDDQPVGVFTLARVRLNRAGAFVAAAAPVERDAVYHPAYLEGTSLMHPPTKVATFTLWQNAKEMRQFTVGSYPGGHVRAMKQQEEHEFHHETLFVRLRPYAVDGQWNGRNPLDMIKPLTTDLTTD